MGQPTEKEIAEALKNNNVRVYIAYLKKVQRFAAPNSEKSKTGFVNIVKDKNQNTNIYDSTDIDKYIVKKLIETNEIHNIKNRNWEQADKSLNRVWEGLPGGAKNKNPDIAKITADRAKLLNDIKVADSKKEWEGGTGKIPKEWEGGTGKIPKKELTYKELTEEGYVKALTKDVQKPEVKSTIAEFRKGFPILTEGKTDVEIYRKDILPKSQAYKNMLASNKARDAQKSEAEKKQSAIRQAEVDKIAKERIDESSKRLEEIQPGFQKERAAYNESGSPLLQAPRAVGNAVGNFVRGVGKYIDEAQLDNAYVAGEISKEDYLAQKKKLAGGSSAVSKDAANLAKSKPKDIEATAQDFVTGFKSGKYTDLYSRVADLHLKDKWSDKELTAFQERVTELAESQPATTTASSAVSKKAASRGTGTGTRTPAPKEEDVVPAPKITVTGVTGQPPVTQPTTLTPKEVDPKGNPDGTDASPTATVDAKGRYKWGVGEALSAAQIGLGLAGADKSSRLAESLVKNFPKDSIPIEAQQAYYDAQVAKNAALTRSRQGLTAAQKAEAEAKIEGTAAADLSTSTNSLSRTLGVRNKYEALLGLASLDESVRSQNEQKYLAFQEGANKEASQMSAIKRTLYEDRRKKWEYEYQRAMMGEQAGAQLLNAGITNLATTIQMKEIESMKKPNIFNITPAEAT